MDDPRPRDAADARQLPRAMVEQRVDHRAVEIARGGMDDHPRGLVDDDQMLVLERDDKVHVLRDIMRGGGGGQADLDRRGRGGLCRRVRSEEHTSELQSLMRISYAVFCLKKK